VIATSGGAAAETGRRDRRYRRRRLHLLDACLQQLEDLHEQDQGLVPVSTATRVRGIMPAIQPGMRIAEAIDLVFSEQEPCLQPNGTATKGSAGSAAGGPDAAAPPPLCETEARALTERIKAATRDVCFLLLEAHERRAWSVLGYRTWEQYVPAEFGLSRSRSYELLDQGRVLRAIKAAAHLTETPDISAYAAGQIKSRLSQVTDAIRDRTARMSHQPVMAVIADVVREARVRPASKPARRLQDGNEVDPGQLREAIRYIAQLPPAAAVLTQMDCRDDGIVHEVNAASRWLDEFARLHAEPCAVSAPLLRVTEREHVSREPNGLLRLAMPAHA
jgi:hypothetical protein